MELIALDTETTLVQLKFPRVRDKHEVPDLVVTGFCEEGGTTWDVPYDKPFLEERFPGLVIVGHNIPYDLAVILKQWPDLEPVIRQALADGRILDTMVMARLREPSVKSLKLSTLVNFYLGRSIAGKGTTQLSFRRDIPLTPEQIEYLHADARTTMDLALALRKAPLGSVYQGKKIKRHLMECPVSCDIPPAHCGFHPLDRLYSTCYIYTRLFCEPVGWDMDLDALEKFRADHRKALEESAYELALHGLIRRVRDTKAPVKETFFSRQERIVWPPTRKWTWGPAAGGNSSEFWFREHNGVSQMQASRWQLDSNAIRKALGEAAEELQLDDVPLSTKTRMISTTYDYWNPLRPQLPVAIQHFLDYARAQKYESLFFANWSASRTGRVYPAYFIPGTVTLRHASSKPNFQQIPKRLRGIFSIAGKEIIGADYSAMELFALCHVMAARGIKGPLYDILKSDVCPHSAAAALFTGGSAKDYPKGSPGRQKAKALNFGIPGGLGVKKVHQIGMRQHGLTWSFDEAKALTYAYKDVFWDIHEYLKVFKYKSPWQLKPVGLTTEVWLRSLDLDDRENISSWDLSGALDHGKIYDVQTPSGAMIPARTFTEATNCGFQSTGAVAVTRATNLAIEAGLEVVAVVHDAIYVAGAPGDQVFYNTIPKMLESCMEQALCEVCPLAPPQTVRAEVRGTFF